MRHGKGLFSFYPRLPDEKENFPEKGKETSNW